MNIEVNKTSENAFEINVKRFYLPFEINWTCPNCKEKGKQDLNHDYLSYPIAGKPFTHTLYCYDCDHEETVNLHIDLDLRVTKFET